MTFKIDGIVSALRSSRSLFLMGFPVTRSISPGIVKGSRAHAMCRLTERKKRECRLASFFSSPKKSEKAATRAGFRIEGIPEL